MAAVCQHPVRAPPGPSSRAGNRMNPPAQSRTAFKALEASVPDRRPAKAAPPKRTLRTCVPCIACKILATAGQPCPRCGLSVPAIAAPKPPKKASKARKSKKTL